MGFHPPEAAVLAGRQSRMALRNTRKSACIGTVVPSTRRRADDLASRLPCLFMYVHVQAGDGWNKGSGAAHWAAPFAFRYTLQSLKRRPVGGARPLVPPRNLKRRPTPGIVIHDAETYHDSKIFLAPISL